MKTIIPTLILFFVALGINAQSLKPCGPVPTENQLRWQDMEMYAFIHYSLNTYTDQEATRIRSCSTPQTLIVGNGHEYASKRA